MLAALLAGLTGLTGLCGCDNALTLVVELRSDFVPGIEVARAITYVRHDGVVAAMDEATLDGQDLLTGARIAEFAALQPNDYRIAVDLFGPRGELVFSGRILYDLTRDSAVTIVASRDCRGVDPDVGCEAPLCAGATDCTMALASCAEWLCIDGQCLAGSVEGACGSSEACVPEVGCVVVEPSSDAGPASDAGADAGPLDAGSCPGECTPGATDDDRGDCGDCGSHTRDRSCGDDCSWGAWSSWSSCSGEGRCMPGATGDFPCGTCGTWTCTCQNDCNAWAACGTCRLGVQCTDYAGNPVCAGDTGFRTCMVTGLQRCTCSSSGTWISCTPGCTL